MEIPDTWDHLGKLMESRIWSWWENHCDPSISILLGKECMKLLGSFWQICYVAMENGHLKRIYPFKIFNGDFL